MNSSNICKNLRTKKMYIPAQADDVFMETSEGFRDAGHCWCNCTLTEVGPDDQPVSVQNCGPSRPCFEE